MAAKGVDYRGTMTFRAAPLLIQHYQPMWADFTSRSRSKAARSCWSGSTAHADGAQVELHRRHRPGAVARADLPGDLAPPAAAHARDLLRQATRSRLHGEGDFDGTLHMYKGGHELKGDFASPDAGYNAYRFQRLSRGGALDAGRASTSPSADARFYGGAGQLHLRAGAARPCPSRRADAAGTSHYRDVDLTHVHQLPRARGMRLGRPRHRPQHAAVAARPLRRAPPAKARCRRRCRPAVAPAPRGCPADAADAARRRGRGARAVQPAHRRWRRCRRRPGDLHVRRPRRCASRRASFATPETYVAFEGRTAWGEASRMPFHVTSADWQESDRLLAGMMTDVRRRPPTSCRSTASAQFDGVLLGALGSPRVEGRFTGRADARVGRHAGDDVDGRRRHRERLRRRDERA